MDSFFDKYFLDLSIPVLGGGSFSDCRKCIEKRTGMEYAVKIKKTDNTQEIELLKVCQGSPYIVQLFEVFNEAGFTYIVTELCRGGDLAAHLWGGVEEGAARRLFAQLALAVEEMTLCGVVHRDLKPQNILLTSVNLNEAYVKVVDFGFARRIPEHESARHNGMMTPCFSLPFAAPEVLARVSSAAAPGYGPSCDMWSLGVIFYTMLCGRAPFRPLSRDEPRAALRDRIRAGAFSMDGPLWDKISADSKRLIAGLLTVDPARRLTLEQLLDDLGNSMLPTNISCIADIYKMFFHQRRNKNKGRLSAPSPPPSDLPLAGATSKSEPQPYPEVEDIPSVKPVEKIYNKSRSKLDDYIESSKIEDIEVETKVTRSKPSEPSPVPRKKRKLDNNVKEKDNVIKLRSKKLTPKRSSPERALRNKAEESQARPTKESIENEKTVTRQRKLEETTKLVLREKGQTNKKSTNDVKAVTKIVKPKKTAKKTEAPKTETIKARSRQHRLEINLEPSEVIVRLSIESDRTVTSIESSKSNKSKKRTKTPERMAATRPDRTRAKKFVSVSTMDFR